MPWDVIVVGSGAAGGWAAKELAEQGLRVLVLEAGAWPKAGSSAPPAGRHPVQSKCYAFDRATHTTFADDIDNPYTTTDGAPFDWIRARAVGGRMRVWDRVCLRMSDRELEGGGDPSRRWPLRYADLAPYYDEVERFLGVCGTADGIAAIPDGAFVPPPATGRLTARLTAALERRFAGRRVTPARRATRTHEATLEAALTTSRVVLRPNAVASRILTDPATGEATGVAFVDRVSGRAEEERARAVVVCASAIESARLLLLSRSDRHPQGLANSSGNVGRFLMDHTFAALYMRCALPPEMRAEVREEEGRCYLVASSGAEPAAELGLQVTIGSPTVSTIERLRALARDLYHDRRPLRRRLAEGGKCDIAASAIGEVAPRFENRVRLSANVRDAWGIPGAHIEYRRTAEEEARAMATAEVAAEAIGADFEIVHRRLALYAAGLSAHEMGTVRMGDDPATSPLDPLNRAWDCPNLLVTDASCFASGGFQNPTLTIMTITLRACRELARDSRLF